MHKLNQVDQENFGHYKLRQGKSIYVRKCKFIEIKYVYN